MIQKVRAEKERLAPDCRTKEYDLQQLWNANEDIRSLKSLILFGIRGMAAYAYHANVLNYEDAEVNQFFCEALSKHRSTTFHSTQNRRDQSEVHGTS